MRRLAILLVLASSVTVVGGTPQQAEGCKLLKKLLHRCDKCHHCGGHKCGWKKCHQPKCQCGHGHAHSYYGGHISLYRGRHHHGWGHGHHRWAAPSYAAPSYAPPYYGPSYAEPGYVEPAPEQPMVEEIPPAGQDF